MIIVGHKYFQSESFYKIHSLEDIKKTPSNATVFIDFEEKNFYDLILNCNKNDVKFALGVSTIKQSVFAHNFKATFLILEKKIAKDVQKIAEEYLFDAKILAKIEDEEEIEELALLGIDGVVFPQAFKEP